MEENKPSRVRVLNVSRETSWCYTILCLCHTGDLFILKAADAKIDTKSNINCYGYTEQSVLTRIP